MAHSQKSNLIMRTIFQRVNCLIRGKENSIVLFLIITIIFAGVVYSFHLGDNLNYRDEFAYSDIAQNLISEGQYIDEKTSNFKLRGFRPPGYPLFLALPIFLGAEIPLLRVLNFIALGASIYLLYRILKNISSKFAGLVGALLVFFYPVLFYTASLLYPQTIASFLLLLILFLLSNSQKDEKISIKKFSLLGIIAGFLILMVPNLIFSVFLVACSIFFIQQQGKLKAITAMLISTCLIISIWSVRNYTVFNRFVFISTNSGINLLTGNSENTTYNSGVNLDRSKYTSQAFKNGLDEVERNSYYKSKAIEFVLNNKARAAKLYFMKALNNFNFGNKLYVQSEQDLLKDIIMFISYGFLIIIFIIRLFFLWKFKPSKFEILLILIYLLNPFFLAIFFTRIRFRLPLDFLLIMIVAMFINNWFSLREEKELKANKE